MLRVDVATGIGTQAPPSTLSSRTWLATTPRTSEAVQESRTGTSVRLLVVPASMVITGAVVVGGIVSASTTSAIVGLALGAKPAFPRYRATSWCVPAARAGVVNDPVPVVQFIEAEPRLVGPSKISTAPLLGAG